MEAETEHNALLKSRNTLAIQLERIEHKLDAGEDTFSFFSLALHAYRKQHLSIASTPHRLLALFSTDPELRFPHRKILECLLQQYDLEAAAFSELPFSKLVRISRVGKQAARDYLNFLKQKRYVTRRSDGYRIWFRISQAITDETGRGEHA